MMKMLLAGAACAALMAAGAAQAQSLPTLSQFLLSCTKDAVTCRNKLRDYVTAADQQKMICRPADQSTYEAASEMLHYLRETAARNDALDNGPYDDALWQAASTMWPCPPAQQ